MEAEIDKTEFTIKDKTDPLSTIKIAPFKKNIRKTKPHKHNKYLEFIYFSKANGYHVTDDFKVEITPPIFFIVRKEQIHFWNLKTEPEGFVIIIKRSYIDNCLDIELKQQLIRISESIYLTPQDHSIIEQMFQLLLNEYNNKRNINIIDGLLKALLGKLLESEKHIRHKNTSLYHDFIELLSRQSQLSNNVEHYANLLNTSPQNLNTSCRNECDKSASLVLSDYILSEAKRLLLYSEKNISEIAYSLSFKDNSHFTKYFKRHVGLTPSKFKNES